MIRGLEVVRVGAENGALLVDTGRKSCLLYDYFVDLAAGPRALGIIVGRSKSFSEGRVLCDLGHHLRKRRLSAARAEHHQRDTDAGEHDRTDHHDHDAELGGGDAAVTSAMV